MNLVGNFLAKTFPGRAKLIEVEGKPYLLRFYLKHNGRLPGVYLHHFYQSDPDRDLHNHPWKWSFSIILTGGYYEYRHDAHFWEIYDERPSLAWLEPEVRERKAPGFNYITGDSFHRVVLKDLKAGAWTIFVSGPEVKDWGFMSPRGFVKHQAYLGLDKPFQDVAPNRETV